MKINIRYSLLFIYLLLFIATSFSEAKTEKVRSKDGVEIAYVVKGKGEPALVFVHGWCWDKSIWENQVNVFSSKYKVITIDLAGHGESGSNRKDWTMRAFGEDIASVVNKLKLEKVILVGHSMGGNIILEAAKTLGNKVIGLIGADTFQKFEEGEPADLAEKYLSTFKDNFVGSTKEYVKLLFLETSDSTLVERAIKKMTSAPQKIAIDILRNSYKYNSIKAVKDLQIPIVSINCDQFPVNLDENLKVTKNFKVKKMHGVGHFVMLEDPNRFNQLLEETIQELVKNE
ncbi:MAG: alpha/beta hydrolase [Ignavibacteriales bacterium]|nr:alpha/beta hydrolase [Ignavibacteriales bacterium]